MTNTTSNSNINPIFLGVSLKLCHWIINLILKSSIQLEPISKFNLKPGYRQAPVVHRHCPRFRDILYYQEHQLHKSLLRTECTFRLRDFTDLTVHSFNRISGVNSLANLLIILKKSR